VCLLFFFFLVLTLSAVCLHEDATAEMLIDVIEGNRVYIPCLYVVNKIDAITMEELEILDRIPNYVPISAYKGWNIDELLEMMWKKLNMVRIYTKSDFFVFFCLILTRHVSLFRVAMSVLCASHLSYYFFSSPADKCPITLRRL
jgi:ribosome-interacting GTPase 1